MCVCVWVGGFFFRFLFAQFHWDAVESMIYCLLRFNHCQSMKIVHWIKHPTFGIYVCRISNECTRTVYWIFIKWKSQHGKKVIAVHVPLSHVLCTTGGRPDSSDNILFIVPKLLFRTSVDHVWLLKMLDVTLNYMHCTLFFITIKLTNHFFCHFFSHFSRIYERYWNCQFSHSTRADKSVWLQNEL